jgi:predicted CXXCH cytochrome family protein
MGKSFVPPQAYPNAVVKHPPSGSVITVTTENGTMFHRLQEGGLTVNYQIPYQVGGGMEGSSFLIQVNNYLFESPVSWFNDFGWDMSPGYSSKNIVEFDRAVSKECVYCHATGARFDDADGRHLASKNVQSIGCERCHGPTEQHLQHPNKSNILNPVKLSGPARDSICEQCHLEGTNRILNPGKDWTDFRAGEPAENTFTTYVLQGNEKEEIPLASEVEQFAQSRCVRGSNGKFWCSACHNPHRAPAPRALEIRSVCGSCHQKLSPTAHTAELKECTSCHMPTINKTTISHASNTDHRILRHPKTPGTEVQKETLVAWRQPPEQFRQRNLGIAELLLSSDENKDLWLDGGNILSSLSSETLKTDANVVSSLQAFYFGTGDLSRALELGQRAVELNPQSANAALALGRVLEASGADDKAQEQFLRAINLNPSWKEAYGRLAMSYAKQRRFEDAIGILDRYLQWNPNEVLFHKWKKQLSSQIGDVAPQK